MSELGDVNRDQTAAATPRPWLWAVLALVGMLYAVPASAQPPPDDERRAELMERLRSRRMYFLIDTASVTEQELPALRAALEGMDSQLEPLRRQRRQAMRAMRRMDEEAGTPTEAEAQEMLDSIQRAEQIRLDANADLVEALSANFSAVRQLEIVVALRRFEEDLRRRQERARQPRGERRGDRRQRP